VALEDQHVERKSLRAVIGRNADWDDIARTCVCFANGAGGQLLIGIENDETEPPASQTIPPDLLDRVRKRVQELTVNVQALPSLQRSANGGEFVEVVIQRSQSVASTADGRFFLRVADSCLPVGGDDVLRLANERPGHPWETMESGVPRADVDSAAVDRFVGALRGSTRIKDSVREKNADELLTHYDMAHGETLTHLGVLLVGTAADRRALGTAPIVQAIKFDEHGAKVNKWVWDDGTLSPVDLVDAVWREVPDFRESYELPEGLYRRQVPAYDEKVIRELVVNALVHRPYTQRGDIFINLHPDRMEIVNPGRLPLGVTPRNILHASRRRNEGLARVFHDLGLMEREGSGYDMIYDRLLSQGRPVPAASEGPDSVHVVIQRRILKPEVIRLMTDADARFQLGQRERIALGVLAQSEGMTARELSEVLDTGSVDALGTWLGRLPALGLVATAGRTKGTRYFVPPALLQTAGITLPTSLRRIEPHRLSELVREDLRRYPRSKMGDISARIGPEVPRRQLRRIVAQLVRTGAVVMEGRKNGARYALREPS